MRVGVNFGLKKGCGLDLRVPGRVHDLAGHELPGGTREFEQPRSKVHQSGVWRREREGGIGSGGGKAGKNPHDLSFIYNCNT